MNSQNETCLTRKNIGSLYVCIYFLEIVTVYTVFLGNLEEILKKINTKRTKMFEVTLREFLTDNECRLLTNQFRALDRKVFLSNSMITEHARGVKRKWCFSSQSKVSSSNRSHSLIYLKRLISSQVTQRTQQPDVRSPHIVLMILLSLNNKLKINYCHS
jgi:hypothetical protein